ncbi:ArnT family glycosyltransferase [Hydrogenophaga sp. ZJX-1]|uniref:ArnT family glycosyltransferase n=1 Tax=Hydrogenophaga sp. ZJX-1 TaxID=3404778 RepID=UPI003B28804A
MIDPTPLHAASRDKAWTTALFIGAALVLLAGIGLRAPWPADEPRFAQIAREMVESGQWLFPLRGGEPYPDKPPVFMWLVALSYSLTGQLKIAFLLPSALAAAGTLWLVHDLGRRLWGSEVARWAVLVLLFTPQFLLQAKTAQIDALVCFWITLGCYGLLRHFLLGPAWRWYALAWVAMALGIMTKGVGFLPMLLLIPLALWARSERAASAPPVWTRRAWIGPMLLLLTLAAWLGPMLWQVQASGDAELAAYRDNILLRQTAGRYANPWGHFKPWHYFLTSAIPLVWFPLAVLLVAQWRRLVALLREDVRARSLFAWVVLVLVFFSLSKGKRDVYILPALPMLSLVGAALWARVQEAGAGRKTAGVLRGVLLVLGILVLVLGLIALQRPEALGEKASDYAEAIADLAWPLVVLGSLVLAATLLSWRRPLFQQLALVSLMCWVFVAFWVWPVMDPHRTPRQLMADLETRVPGETEVGLIEFKEQFLLFSHRPLTHFSYLATASEQERRAWLWLQEDRTRVLLVPDGLELACFDTGRQQRLGTAHRRDWVLLDATAARAACVPPDNRQTYTWQPRRMDILQ